MRLRRLFTLALLLAGCLTAWTLADVATCMQCHEDKELTGAGPDGKTRSMFVDQKKFENSVHGGFDCVDCHADLAGVSDFPHAEQLKPVDCSSCHEEAVKDYSQSFHAKVHLLGHKEAPTCASCHTNHEILPAEDPASPTYKANQVTLCGRCHSGTALREMEVRMPQVMESYKQSAHAKAILAGNLKAATCTDCHGTHDLRGPADPDSRINRWRLPTTCGKCHMRVTAEYTQSIHGKAFELGIAESPTCTDCHGEHMILGHQSKESRTFNHKLSYQLCLNCHSNPRILQKFGSSLGVSREFVDSYHGMSLNLGSKRAAACISCHGTHLILAQRDPKSSIAPGNVVKTCQACHPKANKVFAESYTHAAANMQENKIAGFMQTAYIIMIILVIGGMVVHNLIILGYYFRKKWRMEKNKPTLTRFNLQEIIQHVLLSVTFIGLVITGFALRFSEHTLFQRLAAAGLNEDLRSTLHRIFAIGLLAAGMWHLLYLGFHKTGRKQLKAIMFVIEDMRQAVLNLRHHLGLTKERPLFDRYDYSEKAEYWALIWGTVVMAATGFVLWFPTTFTQFLPFWIVKVSEVIHYYEAILATLAIIVWHFFFVILHPEEYPMNLSWLSGKVTVDLAEEKYPVWAHRELHKPKSKPRLVEE